MTAALNYTPTTTILLSGSLARKFGRTHRRLIDTGQTQEVFKAMNATVIGFEDEIKRQTNLACDSRFFVTGETSAKMLYLSEARGK